MDNKILLQTILDHWVVEQNLSGLIKGFWRTIKWFHASIPCLVLTWLSYHFQFPKPPLAILDPITVIRSIENQLKK